MIHKFYNNINSKYKYNFYLGFNHGALFSQTQIFLMNSKMRISVFNVSNLIN